ncbi:MAG: hypothetical protein PHG40_00785 [Candidatus Omnitrophica bacterium]|nr:hypothetical protein [Candidatus Omnitrophota bacterium]
MERFLTNIRVRFFLLLTIAIFYPASIYAQENVDLADRVIAATFKTLAKGYTVGVNIDKLKEDSIAKLQRMDEDKFRKRYAEVYAAIKDLPPELKLKYRISQDMTKEQVISAISGADKKKIYELIDSVPDKAISTQFKKYLIKKKQDIQKSNIAAQVNRAWERITGKIK